MTTPDGLRPDPNSYIDPMARVFNGPDGVYRAFFPHASGFYRGLLDSPLMTGLLGEGKMVASRPAPDARLDGFDLVVRHQRVSPRSYCFEWPFAMLHRAALLTLEIARRALAEGVLLQDATPFNVLFSGTAPVFVDLSSLVPDSGGYLWAPYNQFCQSFLFPLYLHAAGHSSLALKLLKDSPDGIEAGELAAVLGPGAKLRLKGYASRVALPELALKLLPGARHRGKLSAASDRLMENVDTRKTRGRFLASLQRTVEALRPKTGSKTWVDYYEQTDAEVHAAKQQAVERALSELGPETVVDAGSNTGAYSLLAARLGARVTALDSDPDCVESLYHQAEAEGLDVLPLVANLLGPTPPLGWRNREQPALTARVRSDAALALALIHHLVLSGGQDFERSLAALDDLHAGAMVIEYVDIKDPMTEKLPRRPGVDYGWYTREGFERALGSRYGEVTPLQRLSDTRSLYLIRN